VREDDSWSCQGSVTGMKNIPYTVSFYVVRLLSPKLYINSLSVHRSNMSSKF
jgi:hypothetical protein